jgi:hypothetical protein
LEPSYHPARNLELVAANIPEGRPHHTVEVCILSHLRIIKRVMLETDVGGLLVDVRTAATQPHNSDCCPLDYFLTAFTQE